MLYDFGVTQNLVTIRKLDNQGYKIMLTGTVNDVVCEVKKRLENVKIEGLMTIAPFVDDEKILKDVFSGLKNLANDIDAKNIKNVDMTELSMGMTNDFSLAIRCGSTNIRVGTGIFGKRNYTK